MTQSKAFRSGHTEPWHHPRAPTTHSLGKRIPDSQAEPDASQAVEGSEDRLSTARSSIDGLPFLLTAVGDRQAGFMVLELTWALIPLPALVRAERKAKKG